MILSTEIMKERRISYINIQMRAILAVNALNKLDLASGAL